MARTDIEFISSEVDYPVSIACPPDWLKAEEAWIRIKQLEREPIVGKTDLSKSIVRAVSGRYWLSNSGYVQSSSLIEFKAQEIYYDKELWNAEIASQNYANELTTVDLDINENIDEAVVTYLYLGELIAPIIGSLNLPFISDLNEWIANLLADISSDDINYYPSPYRPDTVTVWIPDGQVLLEVEFLWRKYSPIAMLGGVGEFPIDDLISPPILPISTGLLDGIPILDFDARARARGYILEAECPVLPSAVSWTITIPTLTWVYGVGTYSLIGVSISLRAKIKRFVLINNAASGIAWIDKRGYSNISIYSLWSIEMEDCSGNSLGYIALTQIATTGAPSYNLQNVMITVNNIAVTSGNLTNSSFPSILSQSHVC